MSDEAFTEEDAEYPRQARFKARREMINTMINMGVAPKTEQFVTPKGAIKATKLKEMYGHLSALEGNEIIQIGKQFDRTLGTGAIARLREEARTQGLEKQNEEKEFQIIGTPKLDYFSESTIPKRIWHNPQPKKRTKK